MVIMRNMVNPMYAHQGKQRVEDRIKRPVTGRIAIQDLGQPEKALTYPWSQIVKKGRTL
ncbi:MAG: hypothetical protein LBB48_06860 [Treponema sp.]|nr:hypothetical protein [Treponema sp.]